MGQPPGPPRPPGFGTGPGPGQPGWYNGPFPVPGLIAKESIPRAMGKTAAKCLVALATLGGGGLLAILLLVGLIAALTQAGGGRESSTTSLRSSFVAGDKNNRNKLLAIPVTGVILGEKTSSGGLFSFTDATYGYEIKAKIEAAAKDDKIKAIVLEMDTPGGTIFGARAISDAVAAYRERTNRPVVAYVRGISASGGMYAMAGADEIVADHGTLVGSIGVIFGPLTNYNGVTAVDGGLLGPGVETTGGITQEYITAGRGKDLGNPYRKITPEERANLQTGVDNSYAEFVDHVAKGREIAADAVRDDLGAAIFDEQTAKAKGLIDTIGNRDDAYQAAADKATLGAGNWQAVRLDLGGGGLFGLGVKLAGNDAPPAQPSGKGVCAPLMLAYFGDPQVFCR